MAIKNLWVIALLALAGCNSVGNSFCAFNYGEQGMQYDQCMHRYDMQRSHYNYCISERGITREGTALKQCMQEAPAIVAERERIAAEERRIQAEIDAQQRYEEAQYLEEQRYYEERDRRHERRRVDDIYRHAEDGDILACSITGGYVHIDNNWELLKNPVRFRIARSESREVRIPGGRTFTAGLREDSRLLNICGSRCGGVPVDQGGARIELFVEELFRHATLECSFAEGSSRKGSDDDRERGRGRDRH